MAKSKNLFLSLLIAAFISGVAFLSSTTFSGCASAPVYQNCIDCSQYPLVYQGTVQEYTQGVYLETACLKVDLTKFTGFENIWETLKEGEMIQIWYTVKQGDFCDPNDQSEYRIVPVEGSGDNMRPTGIYGTLKGSQITLKN